MSGIRWIVAFAAAWMAAPALHAQPASIDPPIANDTPQTVDELGLRSTLGAALAYRVSPELEDRADALIEMVEAHGGFWLDPEHAAYELLPNPEFPEDIRLLPIKGRTPETRTAYDPRLHRVGPMDVEAIARFYSNPSYWDGAWASNVPVWTDLGSMEEDQFSDRLTDALGKVLRRHALLALASEPTERGSATCVSMEPAEPGSCPMPPLGRWNETPAGDEPVYVQVEVTPSSSPQYVSVVAIGPNGDVVPIVSDWAESANEGGALVANNAATSITFPKPGRYELFTIVTDDAIDPRFWRVTSTGRLRPSQCDGFQERQLCQAMLNAGRPSMRGMDGVTVSTLYVVEPVSLSSPIVGGSDAHARDALWQAQLFFARTGGPLDRTGDSGPGPSWRQNFEKAHKCGGTYLGDGFVLTSAHCVPDRTARKTYVRLGTRDIVKGGVAFRIEAIAKHSRHDWTDKRADLAVLKLRPSRSLPKLEARNQLRRLPVATGAAARVPNESFVRVTGWGYTGATETGTDPLLTTLEKTQRNPRILQKLDMRKAADSLCNRSEYTRYASSERLCIKPQREGQDACYKDSGGPLTRVHNGQRVLVGVVTAGIGCAVDQLPSVYTRVSAFADWIEKAKDELRATQRFMIEVPG